MNKNFMTVKRTKKDIVIRLPIDLLVWAEEHKEDSPLKIHDKEAMADWIVEQLMEWGGDQDTGSTAFEDFIDGTFMEALEWGEPWLDADWLEL